jgi:cytochrome P450
MEASGTVADGPAPSATALPPGPRTPRTLQTLRFLRDPVPLWDDATERYGETFSLRLHGPGDLVFISDPPSLKRLFASDRVNTIAPGRNIVLKPLLGSRSLLLQEGAEHMYRRKLMLPPFHGDRMRAYEQLIADVTAAEAASWPQGTPFGLHPSMQAITLEVIMRAVFGVTDASRRDALREGLISILAESASPQAMGLVMPGVRRLPHYRDFASRVADTDRLLATEIAERRDDPDLAEREDILSMLIAAEFDDGSRMDDTELRDQLMTLLLAGHETTATGLAWTFDLLLHTPDVMQRLLAELDDGSSGYLDAVITESLRLRPVVPMTGRLLKAPAQLGGFELDAGTVVLAAIYMAHTNPGPYPDPFAFRPERFVDDGPDTYSWIPFGGGTRRCIGAAFAQLEMRVALRTILDSIALRAADPEPERMTRRNVTLSPRNGVRVLAERRG